MSLGTLFPTQATLPAANIKTSRDSSVGIATGYGLNGPGIGAEAKDSFLLQIVPTGSGVQPPIQFVPATLSLG
jgi:hypothetical protein